MLEQSARHLLQDDLKTLDPNIPQDARIRERPRTGSGLWEADRPTVVQAAHERYGLHMDATQIDAVVETAIRLQARHRTDNRHLTAEEWMRSDSSGSLEWIIAWRRENPTKTGSDVWAAYQVGFKSGALLKRASVENYYYIAGSRLGLEAKGKRKPGGVVPPAAGAPPTAGQTAASVSPEPAPTPPAPVTVAAPAAKPQAPAPEFPNRVSDLARRVEDADRPKPIDELVPLEQLMAEGLKAVFVALDTPDADPEPAKPGSSKAIVFRGERGSFTASKTSRGWSCAFAAEELTDQEISRLAAHPWTVLVGLTT